MKKEPNNSSTLVRLTEKGQIVIPEAVDVRVGLEVGDYLEASTDGKRVILTPKAVVVVDRDDPRANGGASKRP